MYLIGLLEAINSHTQQEIYLRLPVLMSNAVYRSVSLLVDPAVYSWTGDFGSEIIIMQMNLYAFYVFMYIYIYADYAPL